MPYRFVSIVSEKTEYDLLLNLSEVMVCQGPKNCYQNITKIEADNSIDHVCSNNFCFTGNYLIRNLEVGLINNLTFGLERLVFQENWQADFETLWNGTDVYKIIK